MTVPMERHLWRGQHLVVHNGLILQPDGQWLRGGLIIRDGCIQAVGADITADPELPCLDAEGHHVLPGVVDPQVHFRDPGLIHKEDLITASRACLRGGVTSFLEMPNTRPPTIDGPSLKAKLERAAAVSRVHYGFFLGACGDGANLSVLEQDNQGPLAQACGIKMFMGTGHGVLECSDQVVQEAVFARGRKLIAVHAEDQRRIRQRRAQLLAREPRPADLHSIIQDAEAALMATRYALRLSGSFQRRLHVLHLSTGVEAELLRREKTALVSTEVTPQHLLLNRSAYERLGALAQMNPPLRDEEDNQVLWQALVDGVIDCIATDHAPHTLEEKARPYPQCPSGMPGVETSLPLMLTQAQAGRCSVADVSRWMSRRPAELYGLEGKGRLAVGWHGDLTVVDLRTTRPVRNGDMVSKCGWSPFDGWELVGWPVATVVAGVVGYAHGVFHEGCRGAALRFT